MRKPKIKTDVRPDVALRSADSLGVFEMREKDESALAYVRGSCRLASVCEGLTRLRAAKKRGDKKGPIGMCRSGRLDPPRACDTEPRVCGAGGGFFFFLGYAVTFASSPMCRDGSAAIIVAE